jgi:hypothetical protein
MRIKFVLVSVTLIAVVMQQMLRHQLPWSVSDISIALIAVCINIAVQLASSFINCNFYVSLRREVSRHLMWLPMKLGCSWWGFFIPSTSNKSLLFRALQMNMLKEDMCPLVGQLLRPILFVVNKFWVLALSLKERHFELGGMLFQYLSTLWEMLL